MPDLSLGTIPSTEGNKWIAAYLAAAWAEQAKPETPAAVAAAFTTIYAAVRGETSGTKTISVR